MGNIFLYRKPLIFYDPPRSGKYFPVPGDFEFSIFSLYQETKNRHETGSNLSLATRLTVLSKRLGRKRRRWAYSIFSFGTLQALGSRPNPRSLEEDAGFFLQCEAKIVRWHTS